MTEFEPRRSRRLPTAGVRHGRQKKSHVVGGVMRLVAIGLAVVLVSAGAVGGIAVASVVGEIKPGVTLEALPGHTQAAIPNVGAIEGGVNLLLTGTDTRSGQGGVYSSKN